MSNTTLFVAQIISVLTYVGIAVGLYALVIKQKDATIEFLQKQVDAAKEQSPDVLLKKLDERLQTAYAEMERLSKDKERVTGYIESLVNVVVLQQTSIKIHREVGEKAIKMLKEHSTNVTRDLIDIKKDIVDVMDKLEDGSKVFRELAESGALQIIITSEEEK